ncbi:DUF3466 family protein [Psychromonas sp. Urea-02u-13]|uniref:DUF3466 family protein n=1 Tax=Psychromonas sp. Urea-02u-13 TaxID=2058326 RepID=UPI000C337867|nr:DUF3466 family protein [Psychromonas sp. Urea-02u-13]PKG39984.1 hypothetical protein CXF74_05315 [Psychromonas sp. Urea-02u-13]
MKFKVTVASLALLMANNAWAQNEAYYTISEISVNADGALYGPFPVAISTDGEFIGTYSMKASLSSNVDIGLPFTFNRGCQYDDILCELDFFGSQTANQHSYENAYQAWRNAQSDADNGSYSSYMMGNTLLNGNDQAEGPFLPVNSSDIKTTDVTDIIGIERFVVGYASAPYEGANREFARRAYIKSESGTITSLLPDFMSSGGFSSAYKLQQVTYTNGEQKTLVIGAASRSYPRNTTEYFNDCYNSNEYDDRYDMNDLVRCPGFDTQAWAWDVTDIVNSDASPSELTGASLATTWLENNTTNQNSLTFSANAFDMNASGTAVGASTFQYNTDSEGARQRAIIMTPDANGIYEKPTELTAATAGVSDQEDSIYNTWALTISDAGIVTGNREFDIPKGRNKATEFFVYDSVSKIITLPFLDKKVATSKQRLENGGNYYISKSGANSRVYAANENGLMVGEVDDFDQVDPVYDGGPRSKTAFLFDNRKKQAWLMNDLICSQSGDVVTSPRLRIRTARVINDAGVVLVDGFEYATDDDYKYKVNAIPKAFKLTPNPAMSSPNDSPNCWESDLLKVHDEPYERQGGATFWLWLFALPLVFIRRFTR